jgi:hypothetical protein
MLATTLMRHPLLLIAATVALTVAGVLLVLNLSESEKKIERRIEPMHALDDPRFRHELGALLGPPFLAGNRHTALHNGDSIFPPMLAAIRSARTSITFETYIYWAGDIGRAFADALVERARGGVQVHVLLDWIGSAKVEQQVIDDMTAAGVQVRKFHPPHWSKLGRMNNRTHRKLLVVGGRMRSPAASASRRSGPAGRRTPSIGATATTRSRGRWWRRCRRCSWTTGSRSPATCCTAPTTFPFRRRPATSWRRSSAARPAAAAKACS